MTGIDLNSWGPATVLVVAMAIIGVIVGGVVVIVNPDTLSFQTYLEDLQRFAVAAAGLALGRGIHNAAKESARATDPSVVGDPSDTKGGTDAIEDGGF